MVYLYFSVAALLVAVSLLVKFYRRLRAHSISYLPGPPPGGWLVGNTPAFYRPKEMGDADLAWVQDFGNSVCIKGPFGSDMLFTADPKALQYILNTAGYNWPKPPESRASIKLTTGKGLVWAEGTQHSRHRKIMNPAFSYGALREFLPIFHNIAQNTVAKLRVQVQQGGESSAVIDVPGWLARTTLDAIGITAFDYQFGAVDGGGTDTLSKAYKNFMADAFFDRSDFSIAFESLWGLLPEWLTTLAQQIPSKRLQRMQNLMKESSEVAQTLLDRQVASHVQGKDGAKDVMSILIRANLSENPKTKLSVEEILPQLTTLILAGHETTANTVTWALYELARHPEFQSKVREEIKTAREQASTRGDGELTVADLDSMKYLLAVMKETLRYHPIVPGITRAAGRNDVIPLSTPQKTKTGEMITRIPVSKGQRVLLSFIAYNRLKSVWGDDADQWRPERFVEGIEANQKTSLGVVANIATFSSGLRSCIGWRFALIEMQAILIEFIENLEFSPPPGNIEIIQGATGLMTPMIKGSETRRTELPITITPISN